MKIPKELNDNVGNLGTLRSDDHAVGERGEVGQEKRWQLRADWELWRWGPILPTTLGFRRSLLFLQIVGWGGNGFRLHSFLLIIAGLEWVRGVGGGVWVPVCGSVYGIPVWGMFYIKPSLAKSISSSAYPFLKNVCPSHHHRLVVHCTPPGWEEGAGSWAGQPAGSPGVPLGSDAWQMRSHPLPPCSSAAEMREDWNICGVGRPGWAEPGLEQRGAQATFSAPPRRRDCPLHPPGALMGNPGKRRQLG